MRCSGWGPAAGDARYRTGCLPADPFCAGNQRRPPEYSVTDTSGPDHNRRYTVQVSVHKVGAVEATASGKREAETEAARLFMEKYG